MPTISVIVPTYQRPEFLRDALASCVAQTWRDLEILVCDNGADEATRAVAEGFADVRIRYLPRPHNLGMLRNAIGGFRDATGQFVVKLDDDDSLRPQALEHLVTPLLQHPDVTLSFGRFDLVDATGNLLAEPTRANEVGSGRAALAPGRHSPADALVARGAVGLVCAVLRRDAIDWDVPSQVATAYDQHLALQAARDGRPVWFVPERLASYRIHQGADSVNELTAQALGSLHALSLAIDSGHHSELGPLGHQASSAAVAAGRELLINGQTDRARPMLWSALARRPDARLARLTALSLLPAPLASAIASARRRRYERGALAANTPESIKTYLLQLCEQGGLPVTPTRVPPTSGVSRLAPSAARQHRQHAQKPERPE